MCTLHTLAAAEEVADPDEAEVVAADAVDVIYGRVCPQSASGRLLANNSAANQALPNISSAATSQRITCDSSGSAYTHHEHTFRAPKYKNTFQMYHE